MSLNSLTLEREWEETIPKNNFYSANTIIPLWDGTDCVKSNRYRSKTTGRPQWAMLSLRFPVDCSVSLITLKMETSRRETVVRYAPWCECSWKATFRRSSIYTLIRLLRHTQGEREIKRWRALTMIREQRTRTKDKQRLYLIIAREQ